MWKRGSIGERAPVAGVGLENRYEIEPGRGDTRTVASPGVG